MSERPRSRPTNPVSALSIDAISRSDESRSVEASWRCLRGDCLVPPRNAVTPRSIPPGLLASIGICAFLRDEASLRGQYRLAGSKFRHLTGHEITGVDFKDVIGDAVDQRVALLRHVLERPVGVWWVSEVTFGQTYTLPYQATMLPLSSASAEMIDHILDFVECELPIAVTDMKGILSKHIRKFDWIDIGAGVP